MGTPTFPSLSLSLRAAVCQRIPIKTHLFLRLGLDSGLVKSAAERKSCGRQWGPNFCRCCCFSQTHFSPAADRLAQFQLHLTIVCE